MKLSFHLAEAAAYFSVPVDEFKRRPVERQAEMIAHVMLKQARDNYVESQKSDKMKATEKAKTHFNPADAQRRKWGMA